MLQGTARTAVEIGQGENGVRLTVVERIPAHQLGAGDSRLRIDIRSEGFAGAGLIWVEWAHLHVFRKELREVVLRRRETTTLRSLSFDKFCLQFTAIGVRSVAVSGRLSINKRGREGGPYAHAVEYGFEIDRERLPCILDALDALDGSAVD